MHPVIRLATRIRQVTARAALGIHDMLEGTAEPSGLPRIVGASGAAGSARDYRLRRDALDRVAADLRTFAESASDEELAALSATCTALIEWMKLQTSAEFWRESERWRIREFVLAAKTSESDTGPAHANPATEPDAPALAEPPAAATASETPPTESTLVESVAAAVAAPPTAQFGPATSAGSIEGSNSRGESPTPAVAAHMPLLARLVDGAGRNSTRLVDGALERTRVAAVPATADTIARVGTRQAPGRKPAIPPTEAAGRLVYLPGDRPHERPAFDLAKALSDLPSHVSPTSVGVPPGARLSVEIVPSPCRSTSIDRLLAPEVLKQIAKSIADASGWVCTTCGAKLASTPECREVFHYDDAVHLQTLVDVVAVCRKCSRLAASLAGPPSDVRYQEAIEHLMEVNDWEHTRAESYAIAASALAEWRSRAEWISDLTWLEKLCVEVTREDLECAIAKPASGSAASG